MVHYNNITQYPNSEWKVITYYIFTIFELKCVSDGGDGTDSLPTGPHYVYNIGVLTHPCHVADDGTRISTSPAVCVPEIIVATRLKTDFNHIF